MCSWYLYKFNCINSPTLYYSWTTLHICHILRSHLFHFSCSFMVLDADIQLWRPWKLSGFKWCKEKLSSSNKLSFPNIGVQCHGHQCICQLYLFIFLFLPTNTCPFLIQKNKKKRREKKKKKTKKTILQKDPTYHRKM